jgi:hypothetical protein
VFICRRVFHYHFSPGISGYTLARSDHQQHMETLKQQEDKLVDTTPAMKREQSSYVTEVLKKTANSTVCGQER